MELFTYVIEYFRSDGGAMMGVVPKTIWSKFVDSDEHNRVNFALRTLVVKSGNRVILVDNGIGTKQDPDFMQFLMVNGGEGLTQGLIRRGIQPEEITDMVLTHLHFDHCGGGICRDETGRLKPLFPNARYWVSRQQWENALHPNPREADAYFPENLLPMEESGVLRLIDGEQLLCEGVEFRLAQGHTPGQIIPVFHAPGQTYVYGADLIPTHMHIPVKYNMAYDLEVLKTMEEKAMLLNEIVDKNWILIFEHDAQYTACTVKRTPRGFRMHKPETV